MLSAACNYITIDVKKQKTNIKNTVKVKDSTLLPTLLSILSPPDVKKMSLILPGSFWVKFLGILPQMLKNIILFLTCKF